MSGAVEIVVMRKIILGSYSLNVPQDRRNGFQHTNISEDHF